MMMWNLNLDDQNIMLIDFL